MRVLEISNLDIHDKKFEFENFRKIDKLFFKLAKRNISDLDLSVPANEEKLIFEYDIETI